MSATSRVCRARNLENDTTNGQTDSTTAAERRPTDRGKPNGEVANILVTNYEDMLRGRYEKFTRKLLPVNLALTADARKYIHRESKKRYQIIYILLQTE